MLFANIADESVNIDPNTAAIHVLASLALDKSGKITPTTSPAKESLDIS